MQTFLEGFEVLSEENAKYFHGLTNDAVVQLYNRFFGTNEKAYVIQSLWGSTARRRFGQEHFTKYKCHTSKRKIGYCKLQPKDPTLWNYLWSIGSDPFMTNDTTSKRTVNSVCADLRPMTSGVGSDQSCTEGVNECAEVQRLNASEDTVGEDEVGTSERDAESAFSEDEVSVSDEDESASSGDDVGSEYEDNGVSSEDDVGSEDELDSSGDEETGFESFAPSAKKQKQKGPSEEDAGRKPLFTNLPDLDSEAMRKYAKRHLQKAPSWIRDWFRAKGFAVGLNLQSHEPHFITADIRQQLEENGFAVIKNVLDLDVLKEARRYIEIKQRSERIDEQSYEKLCRQRYAVGLVTKNGWTKTDYAGYAQQVITASPNLYKCLSELFGTSRLVPNLYEYKYNFGRSSNADEFEFVHADVNYPKLLFAEQVGLPVDQMYQFITPLTPMRPETATVYVSKGFHRHWKAATYRAMKAGHWTRSGWQACSPFKQFLPEDVDRLIEPTLTPLEADPGDLIIFAATLPHGPNLNSTCDLRIAVYPYLAPALDFGDGTAKLRSYLPNDIDSIINSILFGTCPMYSAHGACKYELSRISRHFFAALPYRELRRSILGDTLFGFKPYTEFERSMLAKYLFGPASPEQTAVIEVIHELMASDLRAWNDEMETLLAIHEYHSVGEDTTCSLCNRIAQASLEQWWHSTDAVYHRLADCKCERCKRVKQLGWKHWKDSGGCTCPVCLNE